MMSDNNDLGAIAASGTGALAVPVEPAAQSRPCGLRSPIALYISFTDGLEAAAQICGSLAETAYDDSDAFEAATGCEAAIMAVVRQQRAEQAEIAIEEVSASDLRDALHRLHAWGECFIKDTPITAETLWREFPAAMKHAGEILAKTDSQS